MTVILILIAVIAGAGALLYAEHRLYLRRHSSGGLPSVPDDADADEAECCGMHVTCERDSLLASVSAEIEYYDDEELDRFAGCNPGAYTADEAEEFRDILLTMRADDIAGWARSLQLRNVPLPPDVRDELLMIVAEARQQKSRKDVGVS